MNHSFIAAWRRLQRKLGPMGLAALGCLIAASALALWIAQLQLQSKALKLEQKIKLAAMVRTAIPPPLRQVSVSQQMTEFVTAFPLLSQNAEDLKKVFASAKQYHMLLPKGEYQFRNEADAPLLTVTATFPVSANYASIKGFVADVLKTLPHASLDELRMTRNTAGHPTLDSSIRFTFVYRRS